MVLIYIFLGVLRLLFGKICRLVGDRKRIAFVRKSPAQTFGSYRSRDCIPPYPYTNSATLPFVYVVRPNVRLPRDCRVAWMSVQSESVPIRWKIVKS